MPAGHDHLGRHAGSLLYIHLLRKRQIIGPNYYALG